MSLPEALVWIEGVAGACSVLHATIRHGRDDANTQPEADTLTAELVGPMPPEVEIGATVELVARFGGVDHPRFVGRVSDVGIGWDSVDLPIGKLIAVGELASMGRRIIGDAPYPAELDGARANRAIAAAAVPTDPARSDPGTLTVLPRDVDTQPALAIATDAATDGGGLLWQSRDGLVLYADAEHRRGAMPTVELEACDLPLSLRWAKGVTGLVNVAHVRYGIAAEGGQQPEAVATDGISVGEFGTYAASLTTRLADATDAQARANLIVGRQADPSWVVAGLSIPLERRGIGPALTAALLDLNMHDLIALTGMPAGSPLTTAHVFIEGWTETLSAGAWAIDFAVSDYCRTGVAPQWDDVDPAWAWDVLNPSLTWDDVTCLPPYLGTGRWVDVPSSQRWDAVDPAIEWDAWQ